MNPKFMQACFAAVTTLFVSACGYEAVPSEEMETMEQGVVSGDCMEGDSLVSSQTLDGGRFSQCRPAGTTGAHYYGVVTHPTGASLEIRVWDCQTSIYSPPTLVSQGSGTRLQSGDVSGNCNMKGVVNNTVSSQFILYR